MTTFSDYASIEELIKSDKADQLGIDNTPPPDALSNLSLICKHIFDPLRRAMGVPIHITSGYRCKKLNLAIGGSSSSQHTKGQALDLICPKKGNRALFEWLIDNADYDQLIWEFGNDKEPAWVHVSYKEKSNRRETLKAVRKNGAIKYITYKIV